MSQHAPVFVLGDVMTDVVAHVAAPPVAGSDVAARITPHGGGSAANVAAWLADVIPGVTLIGRVGADPFGDTAIQALRDGGVRALIGRDDRLATGTCVVIVSPDGERTMLPDPGANDALDVSDIPVDAFAPGSHLHVSGYVLLREGPRAAALAAIAAARDAGMTVSVDASSSAPLASIGPQRFLSWAAPADVCFANHEEARVLTGVDDPATAAQALTDHFGLVVVKVGNRGALAADVAGGAWSTPALEVQAIDTTGAGDAFAAGFLASWTSGADPEACLRSGARLARRAVAAVGGRP